MYRPAGVGTYCNDPILYRPTDITPELYAVLKAEKHDAEILPVVIGFATLPVVATVLRVTSRHMKNVALGVDDVLILIGMVFAVAESIYIAIGVHSYELGRHFITLVGIPKTEQFQKLWHTVGFLQPTLLMVTKLSVVGSLPPNLRTAYITHSYLGPWYHRPTLVDWCILCRCLPLCTDCASMASRDCSPLREQASAWDSRAYTMDCDRSGYTYHASSFRLAATPPTGQCVGLAGLFF